jgi:hypothetical protein
MNSEIKLNELRIGNYLSLDNEIYKIKGINKNKIYFYYKKSEWNCNIQSFDPILLDEEILLKCGFIKYNTQDINPTYANKLFNWNDGILYLIGDGFVNHIKYLHQLQNIYHALTNEELEINL